MCYNAGLWHRYFVKMFLGGVEPAEPKVPSLVHKRDRVEVPYTKEEMREQFQNKQTALASLDP